MNNGNLLGDSAANIKRSFAALKLGAPQKDATGKKQTLKISVTPFGANTTAPLAAKSSKSKILPMELSSKSASSSASDKKNDKFKDSNNDSNGIVLKSITHTSDESFRQTTKSSPQINAITTTRDEIDKSTTDYDVKITSSNEKSLLEEISEHLLSKKIMVNETSSSSSSHPIKVVDVSPKNDVIKVRIFK